MQMHSVESSQIKEIGHDASTSTLAVEFHSGGLYHYAGVSAKQFAEMREAKSVGSYLSKHIKGKHDYTKIPQKKDK